MSDQVFNDWYDRYLDEEIEKYAGLDTTNHKGISRAAWQAAIKADRKSRGEAGCGAVSLHKKRQPMDCRSDSDGRSD